jgi:hypothetical protein
MTNPTAQQLIAYRCRVLSQLAGSLAPAQESAVGRALHLIADELFDMSVEINNIEPEESDIHEVLAKLGMRRSDPSSRPVLI